MMVLYLNIRLRCERVVGCYDKRLLLAVWMSFCTILAGQENIILVTDTIDGVSVTYLVEIDMESKREYEKMEEKYNKMVALNEKIESGIPVSQEEMEAVYGKQGLLMHMMVTCRSFLFPLSLKTFITKR